MYEMTFIPCELVTIQVGHLHASVYPKINANMPIFECANAFQVVKCALEPLPINTCIILEVISTHLNCSTVVNGLIYDWRNTFDKAWFNFGNLTIISFHNDANTIITTPPS